MTFNFLWNEFIEHLAEASKISGYLAALSGFVYGVYCYIIRPFFTFIVTQEKLVREVEKVVKEVTNNGGSSIKDIVQRVESKTITIEKDLIVLRNINDALREDGPIGIFECEINGRNTYVNRTYCRWLGVGKKELLNFGWKNYLADFAQNQHYNKTWSDAFKEGRELDFTIGLKGNNGTFFCDVKAYPIRNNTHSVNKYLGLMYKSEKKEDLTNGIPEYDNSNK